jgi:acyl-CoA synthetase (AMP-forming)/AMP-acid ligase II
MGTRSLALGGVLREHARSRPAWTGTISGPERFTYSDLDRRVDRLAAVLREARFGPGDRVLWLGQNSHRALEALLAACRLGGFFCPANWRLNPGELAFAIGDCRPAVLLWQEAEIGESAREAIRLAGYRGPLICHDDPGPGGYEGRLADASGPPAEDPEVDPGSAAIMLYTAAFEGRPNGALISHDAVLAQSAVLAGAHAIGPGHAFLNSGPFFHVGTLMLAMATLVAGGCNVFTRRADPEEMLRLIEAEKVKGAYVVEPTLSRMVELNAGGRYDLSSLVTPPVGGAWDSMVNTTGSPWARRRGGYGQTEVFGVLTMRCLGGMGNAGLPIPFAEVRVVDPEDAEVPAGELGEIVARGPVVTLGYWERPELNARRSRGGWFHTNDLGRREPDGSLSFVAPLGRLIKSGMENIYPSEVEACLKQHPAVAEAVVIGVPDPVWQQSVRVVVVLRPGATATEAGLIEHCRERISSYKKPKSVVFVESLPHREGALDYAAVNRQHGGGGYPGLPATSVTRK